MKLLKDKVAVVTGGTRGIGAAIVPGRKGSALGVASANGGPSAVSDT